MAVDVAFRGRGLGANLLKELEIQAGKAGSTGLSQSVSKSKAALRLLRWPGYEPPADHPADILMMLRGKSPGWGYA